MLLNNIYILKIFMLYFFVLYFFNVKNKERRDHVYIFVQTFFL